MQGTSNTIKEFSEDYNNLYNVWKYVVEQDEDGIIIRNMEKVDEKWEEVQAFTISFTCARKLFKEISECLENDTFSILY